MKIEIINPNKQCSLERELDEEQKKYLSENYFNKININHLRKIKFETPNENECTCYMNTKPNSLLGSMVITEINNELTEQFIHGMPKIHYYDKYLPINDEKPKIDIYEKLDGTNITIYNLYKPESNRVLEVIPKSRNMPVVANEFLDLYDSLNTRSIEFFLRTNNRINSLCFELWGNQNSHGVDYKNADDLNLTLLTGWYHNGSQLKNVANEINITHIKFPRFIGSINYIESTGYNFEPSGTFINFYKTNDVFRLKRMRSYKIVNIFKYLENEIEKLNKNSKCPLVEGVILNTSINNKFVQLKLKPQSIKESRYYKSGIPNFAITKEVLKFQDEYGKQKAEEIINNDINTAIQYIMNQLKEEYSLTTLLSPITTDKIRKRLIKSIEKEMTEDDLLSIANKIIEEYSIEKDNRELMNIFAKKYPDLKHKAKNMFNAFKKIKMIGEY